MKRLTSIILALALILGIFATAGIIPATASTAGHTQAEAVAWTNAKINTAIDYDGWYGVQCVDLVNMYYAYLGQRLGSIGYAYNLSASVPSGWQVLNNSNNPRPGDIFVWDAYAYGAAYTGHTGIITEVRSNSYVYVDYNGGGHNGAGMAHEKSGVRSFSYLVRPDFAVPTSSFDVNVSLDGSAQNSGISGLTFDVYINGSRVANDVKDYCTTHTNGTTYKIDDFRTSGCVTYTGSSSYSGTINSTTEVKLPVKTEHKNYTSKTVSSSCTAGNVIRYTCGCGKHTYDKTTAATGHTFTNEGNKLAKAATCTTPAYYYKQCISCGAYSSTETYTKGSALGHNYNVTVYGPTCTKDGYALYKCTRCSKSYTSTTGGSQISEWSTTRPASSSNTIVETKTQYRKRTLSTTTSTSSSLSGWTQTGSSWVKTGSGTHYYFSRPSGFNSSSFTNYSTSKLTAYDNGSTKREVSSPSHNSYIYWHWTSAYCRGNGGNCFIGSYNGEWINERYGNTDIWEAFESSSDLTEKTYSDGCVKVSGRSNYSYNWFKNETFRQTYTDYQKQYSYKKYSAWSAWQDASLSPSSNTEVETRTLYRTNTIVTLGKATGHSDTNRDGKCDTCGTVLSTPTTRPETTTRPVTTTQPVTPPETTTVYIPVDDLTTTVLSNENTGNGTDPAEETEECDCPCHSSGAYAKIWRILMAICKLLGLNEFRYCECGARHY